MCNISVNVQPTEKVGIMILVALTAHHTPIFTARCGLSVINWGGVGKGGVHCRQQSHRRGKINIVNEEY